MQYMHSLPQYSNLGYIHLVGRCMLSLSQVLFNHPCFAIESDIYYFMKPINNRWAWGMCLKKVKPQDTQSWLHRVSITTCEQEPPGTITLNISENFKILTTYTYHAKRDGQEKSGCKYVSPWHTCKPRPPHIPILGGKLLANIVSCLTYPKLHL